MKQNGKMFWGLWKWLLDIAATTLAILAFFLYLFSIDINVILTPIRNNIPLIVAIVFLTASWATIFWLILRTSDNAPRQARITRLTILVCLSILASILILFFPGQLLGQITGKLVGWILVIIVIVYAFGFPLSKRNNNGSSIEKSIIPHEDSPGLLLDEPITIPEHDKLNRTAFSQHLVRVLIGNNSRSCLVVALHGKWGSGKSSVLNLIQYYLTQLSETKAQQIRIIRFNPWNIAHPDQLISMFFRELKIGLTGKKKDIGRKQLGDLIDIFSSILSLGQLSPVGNQYFSMGEGLTRQLGRKLKDTADKPLADIKQDLDDLLSKKATRIFVFIDDIDRLDKEAMKILFRVIRLNANFRNVTYILAYSQDVVISALSEEQKDRGNEYLEKIVQLSINIPEPDQSLLLSIFNTAFQNYIGTHNCDIDTAYWSEFYAKAEFYRFFGTIREIVRFINGLTVTHPLVADEVNLVDFTGIEVIRLFAPKTYEHIRNNKELFTRLRTDEPFQGKEDVQKTKDILSKVFGADINEKSEATLNNTLWKAKIECICRALFPQLSRIYSEQYFYQDSSDAWRKSKRVCSADIFDKYFILGVPCGEITEHEMLAILSKSVDHSSMKKALQSLFDNDRGVRFFERFGDYIHLIETENVGNVITAIFSVGDVLAKVPWSFNRTHVDTIASHLIYSLLEQKFDNSSDRARIVCDAIDNCQNLLMPVNFVSMFFAPGSPNKQQPGSNIEKNQLFSKEDIETLRQKCFEMLRIAAQNSTLSKVPRLGWILYRWRDFGGGEDAKQYARELITTDQGLLDFLVGFLFEGWSSIQGHYLSIHLEDMTFFIDKEMTSVESRIKEIKKTRWNELSASQQLAIDSFITQLQGN